jgi:hypothetical protein
VADGCGYIDKAGKWIIEPRFGVAEKFSEGLAAVKMTDSLKNWAKPDWGYIDKTGKMVIEPQFANAKTFSEGLAVASLGPDFIGYIDHSGDFVISPQYGEAYEFSDGLAVVLVKSQGEYWKKYAYIDRTGKRNSKKTYTAPFAFKNGLAMINKYNMSAKLGIPWILSGGTACYVDKSEKPIWCSRFHY